MRWLQFPAVLLTPASWVELNVVMGTAVVVVGTPAIKMDHDSAIILCQKKNTMN
jgi:hypothetical protein